MKIIFRVVTEIHPKDPFEVYAHGHYSYTSLTKANQRFNRECDRAKKGIVRMYKNGEFVKSKRINL